MAAAAASRFRDPERVESMLEDDEFNILMYFVHAELINSETSVPLNSILIQTGEGASFGCSIDTTADPKILHWFLENREKAFRMLMGAQTMEIGILSFFQYKVEDEPLMFEKEISLGLEDMTKGLPKGEMWGVYLIDQITNDLIPQDELTHYVINKTDKYGGVTQTQMIKRTNKVFHDKPNIHIFVNCASIPKTFPASRLAKLEIPTGGSIVTRSVTRHIDSNNNNTYTRKNIFRSRDFEASVAKQVAKEIRKKLKAAYSFDPSTLRGFRKKIAAQATWLVRAELEADSTPLKEFLTGRISERAAVSSIVAGLQTQISAIVYNMSLWDADEGTSGATGGGSAERRRRTRRGRRRGL